MATNSREARRRRIVDRGADRLALITGRIQTLPSSSESPLEDDINSSPPLVFHPPDLQPPLPDQTPVFPHEGDKSPKSMFSGNGTAPGAGRIDSSDEGGSVGPCLQKIETSTEAIGAPASEVSSKEESPPVSSTVQNPSLPISGTVQNPSLSISGSEQLLEPQTHKYRSLTPNQITSAIAATENTRLCSSVTIALLVVLSYLGFPLLGCSIMKSILTFRPLFLVLLTNLTVVLAQLLFNKQRGFKQAHGGENKVASIDGYGWAEQASKALEVGLLIKKVIDAVFVDCSVYAILVICGLSFTHLLK